jgi:hypothetical protein
MPSLYSVPTGTLEGPDVPVPSTPGLDLSRLNEIAGGRRSLIPRRIMVYGIRSRIGHTDRRILTYLKRTTPRRVFFHMLIPQDSLAAHRLSLRAYGAAFTP